MLKDLNNGDKAVLLEDLKTINGLPIEAGTQIIVKNILKVTALLESFRSVNPYLEFKTYKRFVVKSEAMFTKIEKI